MLSVTVKGACGIVASALLLVFVVNVARKFILAPRARKPVCRDLGDAWRIQPHKPNN